MIADMWLSAQLQSKRWRGLGLRGVPNASEAARFAIETYGYRGALDVATTLWALARLLGGASGRGPPLRPDTGVPVGVHLNALQRREPKRALLQVTRSNARSAFADKSQPEARARASRPLSHAREGGARENAGAEVPARGLSLLQMGRNAARLCRGSPRESRLTLASPVAESRSRTCAKYFLSARCCRCRLPSLVRSAPKE